MRKFSLQENFIRINNSKNNKYDNFVSEVKIRFHSIPDVTKHLNKDLYQKMNILSHQPLLSLRRMTYLYVFICIIMTTDFSAFLSFSRIKPLLLNA